MYNEQVLKRQQVTTVIKAVSTLSERRCCNMDLATLILVLLIVIAIEQVIASIKK